MNRIRAFLKSTRSMLVVCGAALCLSFILLFCWQQGMFPVQDDRSALTQGRVERIDLNTATVSELTALNGIGTNRAEAIVRYRDAHGPFSSVEELLNVPGIGEGILNDIRNDITLSHDKKG